MHMHDEDEVGTLTAAERALILISRKEEERRRKYEAVLAKRRALELERLQKLESQLQGVVWYQRDGTPIKVSDMTPNHAKNTIPFATRQALMLEMSHIDDKCRTPSYIDGPLLQALRKRAKDEPTFLDKLRDKRSYKKYLRGKKT